ncbi:unnamed protein product [Gordionus sp. m RMFG-2023]
MKNKLLPFVLILIFHGCDALKDLCDVKEDGKYNITHFYDSTDIPNIVLVNPIYLKRQGNLIVTDADGKNIFINRAVISDHAIFLINWLKKKKLYHSVESNLRVKFNSSDSPNRLCRKIIKADDASYQTCTFPNNHKFNEAEQRGNNLTVKEINKDGTFVRSEIYQNSFIYYVNKVLELTGDTHKVLIILKTCKDIVTKDLCDVKENGHYNIADFYDPEKIPELVNPTVYLEREGDRIVLNVDGKEDIISMNKRRISNDALNLIEWLNGKNLKHDIESNLTVKFVTSSSQHRLCRLILNDCGTIIVDCNISYDEKFSNCTYLRCTSTRFYREIWELLNFVPCNPLSNKLSSSKTKSICYKGKCIPEKKNQGKAGSWSSWSSLSKCQGDDTIGFAQRTRKCNNPWPKFGGRYCQGAKIKYEVCQNAFSKNNKKNQALCTEYDNSSIYTELDNKPCFLYCYFKHNNSVANIGKAVDGTIVRMENSMDMFFNGDIIFS